MNNKVCLILSLTFVFIVFVNEKILFVKQVIFFIRQTKNKRKNTHERQKFDVSIHTFPKI